MRRSRDRDHEAKQTEGKEAGFVPGLLSLLLFSGEWSKLCKKHLQAAESGI